MGKRKKDVINTFLNSPKKIDIDWDAEPNDQQSRAIWCSFVARVVNDALLTEEDIKEFGSSAKVWKDQATAWLFSLDPVITKYREEILEVGCGLENAEERLRYLQELVKQKNLNFKEFKRDLKNNDNT